MSDGRVCTKCKEFLPWSRFNNSKTGFQGKHSRCKVCTRLSYAKNTCNDCGKPMASPGKRCRECHAVHNRGINHPSFTGGRRLDKKGYIILSGYHDHPNASKLGIIFEHVLVMGNHLGRALLEEESVHHKNGQRADNRLENLELWSTSQPYGQRVEDKVTWAMQIISQYAPQNLK